MIVTNKEKLPKEIVTPKFRCYMKWDKPMITTQKTIVERPPKSVTNTKVLMDLVNENPTRQLDLNKITTRVQR